VAPSSQTSDASQSGARQNGVVRRQHRPDEQVEASSRAPLPPPSIADGAARQRRLTKQVVFMMLIGWLVLVILVVVIISVT
jgi:hypothetical protein